MADSTKVGAMISKANMTKLQNAHDALSELGVVCGDMAAGKNMKGNYDVVSFCQFCLRECLNCLRVCESCPDQSPEHQACIAACRACITECAICCVECDPYSNTSAAQCVACCKSSMDACMKCMQACKALASVCFHCEQACKTCASVCGECAEECAKNAGIDLDADNDTETGERKSYAQPKEINLSYVKSLGVQHDPKKLAVKFVAKDEIKGYTFLWGNPRLTDVEIEYFTKDSNFWDDRLGKSARPLTWDHAQDTDFKASPIIGEINDFGDDELGRWYVAKLDTSHKYRKVIDRLIKDGVLGTSSDSAPQYVVREKTGKSIWLKEWPWFASALTNTPAEPRMIGSLEFLKSLGVQLPDVDAVRQRQRARERELQYLNLKIKE